MTVAYYKAVVLEFSFTPLLWVKQILISGAWKDVTDMKVTASQIWKDVSEIKVTESGAWKDMA